MGPTNVSHYVDPHDPDNYNEFYSGKGPGGGDGTKDVFKNPDFDPTKPDDGEYRPGEVTPGGNNVREVPKPEDTSPPPPHRGE